MKRYTPKLKNLQEATLDDEFINHIADLTDRNKHLEARVEIAKKFGMGKFEKLYNLIIQINKLEQGTPSDVFKYGYSLTKQMFDLIRKKDKKSADKLWNVL